MKIKAYEVVGRDGGPGAWFKHKGDADHYAERFSLAWTYDPVEIDVPEPVRKAGYWKVRIQSGGTPEVVYVGRADGSAFRIGPGPAYAEPDVFEWIERIDMGEES